jgi:jmjN domain
MAATATMDHLEVERSPDKEHILPNKNNAASHIQTPPASDGSSHSHKDDDAASSSSLSDLDEDMETDARFEDGIVDAGADTEDERRSDIKPDRYEGGIPIFTPVRGSSSSPRLQSKIILVIDCPLLSQAYSCSLNAKHLIMQTIEEFKDFEAYVKGVNPYGMQSGIVLIDPPEEW